MDVWDAAPLILAPFIGSFLGVLIRRLPQGRPVAITRSVCEGCQAPIAAGDLLPLLSHMRLRGRCRSCGTSIARFHWQIELAAVAVAVWAMLADPARVWPDCGLGWTLLALAWIDWEHFRLPDALTLPLIPAGLLAALWEEPEATGDRALAALLGYALFRGVALLYRRLRGRDGLGEGDAKLLAAIGAWVGTPGVPVVLLGAALAGLGAAAIMRSQGKALSMQTAIPFGPCIALAGWLVRLYA